MTDLELRGIVMSDAPATCPYTYYVDGREWITLEPGSEPITAEDIKDLEEYDQEVCLQDGWTTDVPESD